MPNPKIDKILVINSGSSSLKFMLFRMTGEVMLAKGLVERIGLPHTNFVYQRDGEKKSEQTIEAANHAEALEAVCKMLIDPARGVLSSLTDVQAIGHRVVHGGERFSAPILVDNKVIEGIEACATLAPLHNPPNLGGIVACEKVFPGIPNVAVFDTAFHQTMPEHTYLYAIPKSLYKEHEIRKYGFHGTSHKFVAQAAAETLGKPLDQLKLITCHLGNGSSITAVDRGRVLDTSMGLTPLPGVIMGTRCGDIDPAIILYLAREVGMSIDAIDTLLNKKSGLLAISGTGTGDMRDLINAAADGSAEAATALKMFAHRIALYIGGYHAVLGGADAIIMTGGIGENSAPARAAILANLSALGAHFDPAANKEAFGKAGRITTPNSTLPVYVIPTNEELMIARETFNVLR